MDGSTTFVFKPLIVRSSGHSPKNYEKCSALTKIGLPTFDNLVSSPYLESAPEKMEQNDEEYQQVFRM